ncbi:MAG: GyrI-like domain-containing protein, partial [Methylocystis sp.]
SMGFFDDFKDFWSTLRRLAAHWRFLGALVLLLAVGALFLQKKYFPSTPAPSSSTAPERGLPADKNAAADKAAPSDKSETETPAESIASQTVDVAARPVLVFKGEGKWDDATKILTEGIAKVTAAAAKAGIAASGRPLAVFTQTDDNGFHYEAMLPIAKAPDGKIKLPDGVEVGSSPAGKALKFEHRGSYDEIDATYEAITAYLDEKGLDTKNVFIEEYLTDLKAADDAPIDVDIYVFVK